MASQALDTVAAMVQTQPETHTETPTRTRRAGWRAWAECAGLDTEIFYPEPLTPDTKADAKAVCARCPVRLDCLAEAIAANEPFGIRGGLTPRERRSLLRRLQRDARREAPGDRHTTVSPRRLVAVDCG